MAAADVLSHAAASRWQQLDQLEVNVKATKQHSATTQLHTTSSDILLHEVPALKAICNTSFATHCMQKAEQKSISWPVQGISTSSKAGKQDAEEIRKLWEYAHSLDQQ